jgi:hypothetical protein
VLACDVNKEWTDKAQEYWQQAGVKHKVLKQIFLKETNFIFYFFISSDQAPILGLIPYAIISASFSFFFGNFYFLIFMK